MPHRTALAQWRRVWANLRTFASTAHACGSTGGRRRLLRGLAAVGASALAPAGARAAEPPSAAIVALLPIDGANFGRVAAAVRAGLTAAWNRAGPADRPALLFVASGEAPADVLPAYSKALASGARVVIGPLIRDQASALAVALAAQPPINVPTIMLNLPEAPTLAQNLFVFGLPAEDEARQIARVALSEGRRRAAVLAQAGVFPRRLQQAYTEAFIAGGGQVVVTVPATTDATGLGRLGATLSAARPDMLFLASDLPHARLARPFIDPRLPTYSTSHLWSGTLDPGLARDLDDTRLLDAPWLVSPDHPAVMAYARSQPPLSPELERLYALGIDAWRLAEFAHTAGTLSGAVLDGVTGRLEVSADRRVRREALPARLREGRIEPLAAGR